VRLALPQLCLIVEIVLSVIWTFTTVHGDEQHMSLCQLAIFVARYFILCLQILRICHSDNSHLYNWTFRTAH
jgi:hypothetical protein